MLLIVIWLYTREAILMLAAVTTWNEGCIWSCRSTKNPQLRTFNWCMVAIPKINAPLPSKMFTNSKMGEDIVVNVNCSPCKRTKKLVGLGIVIEESSVLDATRRSSVEHWQVKVGNSVLFSIQLLGFLGHLSMALLRLTCQVSLGSWISTGYTDRKVSSLEGQILSWSRWRSGCYNNVFWDVNA